jgi:putative toxin-antitoxin system antitoxin component (TIGR02293 family)
MTEAIRERALIPETDVELLGMERVGTRELVRQVNEGFSYEVVEAFRGNTGLSANELAGLVQINPRTLSRRKLEGRLRADESDRILRLSRVFASTLRLFGGELDKARHWLATPKTALGGESPMNYSRVDVGAREVIDLIGRVEHGVIS